MVEHGEKGHLPLRSRKLQVAISIGVAGVLAAGWGIKSGVEDLRNLVDGDSQPKRTESLEDLKWQLGLSSEVSQTDLEYTQLVSRYLDARNLFRGFSSYELNQSQGSEIMEFVNRERLGLVFDGAVLFRDLVPNNEIEINQEKKWVKINGIEFDLDDLSQLFLADGIISQSLIVNHPNSSEEIKQEALGNLDDLYWLVNQELPIVFDKDVYGLPSESVLANLSNFYQKIVELDYPLPSEIWFKRYAERDHGAGWYDPPPLNRIVVTEKASDDTPIHEGLHHQAFNNPEFSQARFDETINAVKANIQGQYNVEDVYINPGVLDEDTPKDVAVEDYAETLKTYFVDGIGFRLILKDLFLRQRLAYEVVQAKYDFARQFYDGSEYLKNREVFEPKAGDIFKIDDPDVSRSGIYLRLEPTFDTQPESPVVYDTDHVMILDGPKLIVHPETGREVKMWKVRKVYYYDYYGEVVLTNEIGWMWEIWFGYKFGSAKKIIGFRVN